MKARSTIVENDGKVNACPKLIAATGYTYVPMATPVCESPASGRRDDTPRLSGTAMESNTPSHHPILLYRGCLPGRKQLGSDKVPILSC